MLGKSVLRYNGLSLVTSYGPRHAKPSLDICWRRRPRLACALAQSDQGLCCPQQNHWILKMFKWSGNALMGLCVCAGWCESVHFAHVWRHFFFAWPAYIYILHYSNPRQGRQILSWILIMKYFQRSFSPFRWFKKGSCQFLAKECAQYWLTA